MENHMHMVARAANLSKEVGDFKSYTGKSIVQHLKQSGPAFYLDQLKLNKMTFKHDREHQVWQEGSHPQMIDGDAMMHQKVEYIHLNPVRRGLRG